MIKLPLNPCPCPHSNLEVASLVVVRMSDRRKQQMATALHKPVCAGNILEAIWLLFGCLFSAIICQTDFHASLTLDGKILTQLHNAALALRQKS